MRLFSRGSQAEEGAIGQEVTGTSKRAALTLIALLVAGADLVLTGSTRSGTMIGFMRPTGATAQVRAAP
jgi:hypothetical protein